jgi:PTS system ascorbate-specific IIC component
LKFPEWIGFMREPLVAMGTVMLLIYLVSSAAAINAVGTAGRLSFLAIGMPGVECPDYGVNLAAGVGVILLGVRMILAKLFPAFRGFAERVVPTLFPPWIARWCSLMPRMPFW